MPRMDRRGLPRAARRLHRQVGLRHQPVLRWLPVDLQGHGRQDLRLPKDGNTIGMAYNTASCRRRRRRWTSWSRRPQALKGTDDLGAPICLNPGLDRGLAFLYAQGGEPADRRRHGLGHRHRGLDGRRPVVPGPVQERPRHDRRRPGRRLVRRGARQGPRRHRLRRRLARSVHDQHLPGRQLRLGGDADRLVGQPGDDLVHGQLLDRRRLGQQGPGVRPAELPGRPDGMDQVDGRRRCASVPQGRPDARRQGRPCRGQCLRPAGLRLHARLRRRPEGVPGRVHRPDPGQDL